MEIDDKVDNTDAPKELSLRESLERAFDAEMPDPKPVTTPDQPAINDQSKQKVDRARMRAESSLKLRQLPRLLLLTLKRTAKRTLNRPSALPILIQRLPPKLN